MVAAAMRGWRRGLRPLLAILALFYLIAMVVSGAMPVQRQLVRFEAKGVLKITPEQVSRVELSRGAQRLTLLHRGETDWATPDGTGIGTAGSRVSTAVRIMHNSGPVREIEAAELVGTDAVSFGLDPPQLSVTLYGERAQPVLTARFGEYNPEGFLQYMRLDGDAQLYLMSRFVGGEWREAMAAATAP
jgi:hypothetical protein